MQHFLWGTPFYNMKKRLTSSEFISKAITVHGDKYDYSKVEYISNKTKICIICPIHGEFWQTPNNHLTGNGCTFCRTKRFKTVFGIGIFDYKNQIHRNTIEYKSYTVWNSMLRRCYSKIFHAKSPTYFDCTVCKEWLLFSNFKKWFDENYIEGNVLDKDILVKGNKVYSPETCCFVPHEINALLTKRQNYRGKLPIGVKTTKGRFISRINKGKERIFLGVFNNANDAFYAYKTAKENYVKELAETYYNQSKITKNVYDSLMKYEVSITD